MDKYKLQLLRERDEVWAEARESMPLSSLKLQTDLTIQTRTLSDKINYVGLKQLL